MIKNLLLPLLLLPMLPLSAILAGEPTFREMRRDKSTRGVEFSIKAIGSPGGACSLVNGSDYVCGALGGEMTLGYRVNKAFTAGFGFDYVNAWNKADYGTGFTSVFYLYESQFQGEEEIHTLCLIELRV